MVHTIDEVQQVAVALLSPPEVGDDAVLRWCLQCVDHAQHGKLWLVVHRVDGVPFELSSIDDVGRMLSSTATIRAAAAEAAANVVDDEDWDLRT
jgi:hypothetical protein